MFSNVYVSYHSKSSRYNRNSIIKMLLETPSDKVALQRLPEKDQLLTVFRNTFEMDL